MSSTPEGPERTAAAGPRATSASELKEQIEAERDGRPFLAYRDAEGSQCLLIVEESTTEVWVGRSESAQLRFDWDQEVSTLHAQIEVVGTDCTLIDDGLSRNGSFVNEERISGRRLLRDGDIVRVGKTAILYRAPGTDSAQSTVASTDVLTAGGVSPAQRRVLLALCRPYKEGAAFATPATNKQIAEELHLSVDAVKTHLRALFEKFGLEELPQNRKRVTLVESAMQSGLVREQDL
ncbi:MAG: FHA domain-containing protein [Solirubrobacterales bacterium]